MEIQGRNTNDEIAIGWRRPHCGEAHVIHGPIRSATDVQIMRAQIEMHLAKHYHTMPEKREVREFWQQFTGNLKTAYGIGLGHLFHL